VLPAESLFALLCAREGRRSGPAQNEEEQTYIPEYPF